MPITKERVADLLLQVDPTFGPDVQSLLNMPDSDWEQFSKFLSLIEEEAVLGKGSWVKREDIETQIRQLDRALNPTQARSALAKDPDLIDVVAQAIPVIQAGQLDTHEVNLLRKVYEQARNFLRFNGIDTRRANQAIDRLDDAVENVKVFDSQGGRG